MPNNQSSIVSKCFEIMEVLAAAQEPLRLSEIIVQTGFAKPNTHRLLGILVAERMIIADKENATYRVGIRPTIWTIKGWQKFDIRKIASEKMNKLHQLTEENILLAVPDGATLVYLDKRESQKSLRIVSSVGNRAPFYCTGLGKAMLAHMSEEGQADILAVMTMKKFTKSTITSKKLLLAEMKKILSRGYSIDDCEHQPDINCIAAPVFDFDGKVAGGISISAPTFRTNIEKLVTYADDLLEATREITHELRYRAGPQ